MEKLGEIKNKYQEIITQLQDPELVSDFEKFEELSKKRKELEKIIERSKELDETSQRITENKSIIAGGEDPELVSLATGELVQLEQRQKELAEELEKAIKDEGQGSQSYAAIIEIRAGTGGEEAALFAGDLYEMYTKYANLQGWKQKVLESHPSELKGIKEIIFELKNGNIYSQMKYEGGVHRVQRIPETEKMGRVHTSTASVAVLPKPRKAEIKINPGDLKIDVYKSSGPGGQNVNKRETAVRITHLPTGMVITSQTERNLLQNKANAMAILEARLLERQEEKRVAKLSGQRKEQIGSAKRSEKIRTYNFPQDRITDHRIKKSWHGIEEIMNGKMDKMIENLQEGLKS